MLQSRNRTQVLEMGFLSSRIQIHFISFPEKHRGHGKEQVQEADREHGQVDGREQGQVGDRERVHEVLGGSQQGQMQRLGEEVHRELAGGDRDDGGPWVGE